MNTEVAARPTLFRQALLSARQGIHLPSFDLSSQDAALAAGEPWRVRLQTLRGGKQEGVNVVEIDNGRLKLSVIPTRGMSLLRADAGDIRLGWDSPVKEVVHPQFIRLESRSGLGWLDGFNEAVVRCGLEWAGHPGPDRFRNASGDDVEMNLSLHGKIGNIPASEVEFSVDAEPPHRLRLRGLVEEKMFHGPQFSLWTEISTEPGSLSFRIEDAITNHDAHPQEFQIIYHANFGPPLLEAGSRFFGAPSSVTPFNTHAAKGLNEYDRYTAPEPGFVEEVYCLYPGGDAAGRTALLLQNAAADRGVEMAFDVASLPCVTLWKNLASLEEGYVTGLEPGTSFPANRRHERVAGRVPRLGPGETRRFGLDFSALPDAAAVTSVRERIQALQSATPYLPR
ncbi:MAG TPA: aldose 1-epimerase family protein [Verrucomicrobiae bacterium]|jgi:hypothetical protein|nr:aldose 1-epimerase family protein [Verrucomicrobiae bacterium]